MQLSPTVLLTCKTKYSNNPNPTAVSKVLCPETPSTNRLLSAAKRHYEAKRDEAIANLEVHFTEAVALGEYSDLQLQIRKWTDELSNVTDGLKSLEKHFTDDGSASYSGD